MFTRPTVFILGAGASWHYGYPTGEALIDHVVEAAKRLSAHCANRLHSGQVIQLVPHYVAGRMDSNAGTQGARQGWERVRNECDHLVNRLRTVRPLVIDYFLAWNESLRDIGKLMIASAILECEAEWFKAQANENRRRILASDPLHPFPPNPLDITKYKDDWHRFVVHKLVYGCGKANDLLQNKVHFITFNYDTSLELQLFRALSSIDVVSDQAKNFLTDERVVHVYGSVHPQSAPPVTPEVDLNVFRGFGAPFTEPLNHQTEFGTRQVMLDQCSAAARGIRTIETHDKNEEKAVLDRARHWLAEAEVVYVLGYGFDPNNSRRIGLSPLPPGTDPSRKKAYFTNFRDAKTITKRAGATFVGWSYAESSDRDVYEAIERDFDALGSEVIPEAHI